MNALEQQIEELARAYSLSRKAERHARSRVDFLIQEKESKRLWDEIEQLQSK